MTPPPTEDRIFFLVREGEDLATLTSQGSGGMFWETFRVEPHAGPLSRLLDADAWSACAFTLRHARTGIVHDSVFSAGGRAPARHREDGPWMLELRGTYMFVPPAPAPPLGRRLADMLRLFFRARRCDLRLIRSDDGGSSRRGGWDGAQQWHRRPRLRHPRSAMRRCGAVARRAHHDQRGATWPIPGATVSYTETLSRLINADYADASPEERAAAVRDLVSLSSVTAAALAIQPIPLLDVVLIIPLQIAMVQGIGRVYGHRLDHKSVIEMLGTFGAGIVAQNVMMAAAKFVPFAGWIAASAMAYALTYAIGEVADHYFRTGRGVPPDELRAMFRKLYSEKKTERETAMRSAPSLKERLEQLNEARAAGLINEAEYERKKQEILGAL